MDDAVLDEVPVGLEVLDDPAQPRVPPKRPMAQLHELGRAQPRRDLAVGVVEQLVEQVLPALVERQLALQLVEHGEAGRQAGFDRELEEQAPGEGVQRADRGVVERLERRPARRSVRRRRRGVAKAVAKIGRRLLGERDGGDGLDRHALVDQRDDALDECRRLARRRPRPRRTRSSRCRPGCAAGGRSGGGAGARRCRRESRATAARHSAPILVRASPNHRVSRGSCRLRSHSAQRTAVPSPSGSQYSQSTNGRHAGGSGCAGKKPASMPSTTSASSSPTGAQTRRRTCTPIRLKRRASKKAVLGADGRVAAARVCRPPPRTRAAGSGWRRASGPRRRARESRAARLVVRDDERAVGQLVDRGRSGP